MSERMKKIIYSLLQSKSNKIEGVNEIIAAAKEVKREIRKSERTEPLFVNGTEYSVTVSCSYQPITVNDQIENNEARLILEAWAKRTYREDAYGMGIYVCPQVKLEDEEDGTLYRFLSAAYPNVIDYIPKTDLYNLGVNYVSFHSRTSS